jgi:hypothetical protein
VTPDKCGDFPLVTGHDEDGPPEPVALVGSHRLDHEPDVWVSAATVWEVAIKQAIGKLKEPAMP